MTELTPDAEKSPTPPGMRRFRLISGVVLLIMLNYVLFAPEIASAFWHLFHGSHVEMQGIRFKVPLLYSVNPTAERNKLNLRSYQGIVRQHYNPAEMPSSSIYVDMRPAMMLHAQSDPQREALILQKIGMKSAGEFTASVAGRQGICRKTIEIEKEQEMWISCSLGNDLGIAFSGPARKSYELDNFIRDAKAVSQNR